MSQETAHNRGKGNEGGDHDADQPLLGNYLQRERLKKHLSLEQAAEETCIHIATLRAIEGNDRSKMPAEVFSRGFIRLYAEYLGLDARDILERYRREMARNEEDGIFGRDVFHNEKLAESANIFNVRKIFVIIFVALLLALGFYFFFYGSAITTYRSMIQPGKGTPAGQDLPESPTFLPEQSESPANVLPDTVAPESPTDAAGPPVNETLAPPADIAPDTPPVSPEPAETIKGEEAVSPGVTSAVPDSTPSGQDPATAPALELRMVFSEKTWLQVIIDDQPARDFLFNPGEENRWTAKERIKLHLGNSGGVRVFVNNRELTVAGTSGTPLRLTLPDDIPPADRTDATTTPGVPARSPERP
ncbi:MAG: RodZ domain-containing protein [Thermodesulfobacteriota bacterium]